MRRGYLHNKTLFIREPEHNFTEGEQTALLSRQD